MPDAENPAVPDFDINDQHDADQETFGTEEESDEEGEESKEAS